MDGFKNSTKTHYMKGGACEGYAKGGSVKGAAKINKVMGEFKRGELHSGSKKGAEVTNPKQAVAIALSEARKAGAKVKPVKKADGGGISTRPTDRTGRRVSDAELDQAGRDVGGLSAAQIKATGRQIASGNRVAAEEGNESRLVRRREGPKDREVAVQNSRAYSRVEPAEPQSPLSQRLSQLPSQRGEMRRGPAGAGFGVEPLVSRVRGALGLKKGGLSTMPRGKKC